MTHLQSAAEDAGGTAKEIMQIWVRYIEHLRGKYPVMPKREPWAAALEAAWKTRRGLPFDLAEVARRYHTTTLTLKHHMRALLEASPEENE